MIMLIHLGGLEPLWTACGAQPYRRLDTLTVVTKYRHLTNCRQCMKVGQIIAGSALSAMGASAERTANESN